jgi:hypothetical protein
MNLLLVLIMAALLTLFVGLIVGWAVMEGRRRISLRLRRA